MSIPLKNIKDLSERLIYIRRVTGMSQSEMAKMAGTTQQAIQQAEAGKARHPRYLNKLAHKLDIPAEWLTMNMMPEEKPILKGLKEKDSKFVEDYLSFSSKEQKLVQDFVKNKIKGKK